MAPDGQGGQLPLDCDAANPDTFSKTARKNVLLVIADDQAYCHYGFMSGQCSGSGQLCWSEKDCGSGHCVTTRECSDSPGTACTSDLDCGGTGFCRAPPGQPLRLNELTCRNRQPAHPKGDEFCADPRDDDGKGAKDHFHYDRTKFPCGDTTTAALAPPRTPYLDDLAAGGRSFRGRT